MTGLQARVHAATKSVLTHGSRRLICVEDQVREGVYPGGCLYALHSCQKRYDFCYVLSVTLLPRAGLAMCGLKWIRVPLEFIFYIWDELCNEFCVCDFFFRFQRILIHH
jgi:hypothetical protein